MAAVGAHELAATGVLVPIWVVAVAAAACGGLAELLELKSVGAALLAEARGAACAPEREAGEENLVPEEGEEEDGDAGEARGGDLEAVGGGQELGERPEEDEREDEPRQHGGDAPRPPLHGAQYTHYPTASAAAAKAVARSSIASAYLMKIAQPAGCLCVPSATRCGAAALERERGKKPSDGGEGKGRKGGSFGADARFAGEGRGSGLL
jgi:hypothetical protein